MPLGQLPRRAAPGTRTAGRATVASMHSRPRQVPAIPVSSRAPARPHVAIISIGYPPIPHVSGTRAAEMAAALVTMGFLVTAITVDWRPPGTERPPVGTERGVRVVRVDPRQWNQAFDPSRPPFKTEVTVHSPVLRRWATLRQTIAWGSSEQWARHALQELRTLHAECRVDIVWAIYGGDSCHEVAARFHRETKVPWVADFKDPWNAAHTKWLLPLKRLLAQRRLRTCAALTETSDTQGQLDASFGRPWYPVWSGYDPQIMQEAEPLRIPGRFTVAYFGNVSALHDVPTAARALRLWYTEASAQVVADFHIFGSDTSLWENSFRQENIAQLLQVHPFVDRKEVFARMRGADVLVLLPLTRRFGSHVFMGVKELEYFASGTPVLCIGELLPELQREFGAMPQVMQTGDAGVAAGFLREEYVRFKDGLPSARRGAVNSPRVTAFSWRNQAQRLADVLESVTAAERAVKSRPEI